MPFHPAPAALAAHKQVKGAELPFEDERFAYVALVRAPVARASRVLAQPTVSKVEITAKLCTPAGLAFTKVPRRDKADYASARRWRWGDAVDGENSLTLAKSGLQAPKLELIPPHFRLTPCHQVAGGLLRARFSV